MELLAFYLKICTALFICSNTRAFSPLSCNFDLNTFCDWTNHDRVWSFAQTESKNGSFIKASSNDVAKLVSPFLNATKTTGCLKFRYFQSEESNKFKVLLRYNNSKTRQIKQIFSGASKTNEWTILNLDVSSTYDFQIVLAANKLDIAVDDIVYDSTKRCKKRKTRQEEEEEEGGEPEQPEEAPVPTTTETIVLTTKVPEAVGDEQPTTTVVIETPSTTVVVNVPTTTESLIPSTTVEHTEDVRVTTTTSPIEETTELIRTRNPDEEKTEHISDTTTVAVTESIYDALATTTAPFMDETSTEVIDSNNSNDEDRPTSTKKPETKHNGTIFSSLSTLPASIEKIFGSNSLIVVLISGALIIVITPTLIFFIIFFVYKQRKYKFKLRYTEFDDMLRSDTGTIIRKINRLNNNGSIRKKSLTRSSILNSSVSKQARKISTSSTKNGKKSNINPLFSVDETRTENTYF